jgi:hypothetical protein
VCLVSLLCLPREERLLHLLLRLRLRRLLRRLLRLSRAAGRARMGACALGLTTAQRPRCVWGTRTPLGRCLPCWCLLNALQLVLLLRPLCPLQLVRL